MDADLHPRSPYEFRCVRCTDKVLWSTGLLAAVGHSVRVSIDVALVTLTCAVLTGLRGQIWTGELEHAGAVCSFGLLVPCCLSGVIKWVIV